MPQPVWWLGDGICLGHAEYVAGCVSMVNFKEEYLKGFP